MISFKDFINEDADLDMKLKKLGLKRGGMGFKTGKVIGGEVYLHKQYEDQLPDVPLQNAKNTLPKDFEYQVIKFNPKIGTFSFIQSKDFDTNPEPSVNGGITVKSDGTTKPFKDAGWIYHHKHQMVDDDYEGFDVEENKRRSLKWASLDGVDKTRIGQRKHWDDNVVPRLQESLENIKFKTQSDKEGGLFVFAFDTTKQDQTGKPLTIAHLHIPEDRIYKNSFSVGDVHVSDKYRRQGIASKMYEMVEKKLKMKAEPSSVQTDDAKGFWRNKK